SRLGQRGGHPRGAGAAAEDRDMGNRAAALSAALFALVLAIAARDAAAQGFYQDKTIRILTSAVGSSYDAYARLVARYLPRHLEGGVKAVIVQDMPGATIKVPLYLWDVARSDPTAIAIFNNAAAFAPL